VYVYVCMCVSVCLSASISEEPRVKTAPHFRSVLPVPMARSSSGDIAVRCILPVLRMTPVSRDGPRDTGNAGLQWAAWLLHRDV